MPEIDKKKNDFFSLIENAPPLYHSKHVEYVETLASKMEGSFEGALTNHLKLGGVYWSVTAMSLLLDNDMKKVDEHMGLFSSKHGTPSIIDWIETCFDDESGGYGGDTGQDGHITYTLYAILILAMADRLDMVPVESVVKFIASLQQTDGSFVGDSHGEVDTRFSYCGLACLSILNRLDAIKVEEAALYVKKCRNAGGGFGCCVGAESHAGQVFCCVAALSIARQLDPDDALLWWLSERQCDSGGLNGRSEKQADVCYSWWILSSLSILGCTDYISKEKLASFILKAQDPDDGGIADRPDDMADVFHTFFGIAGLSLIGLFEETTTGKLVGDIDPIYAIPTVVVKRLKLTGQVLVRSDRKRDDRLQQYSSSM
mmetsp:Transcript_29210/g.44160  ORF Transcript_29210/g.44160 Transcript_29210/m.44160 type:complete len:372 (+) Transcript_29210:96-1211(+)|eukprot:CAMPEP_0178919378 /NCGR_PEP_ID=MMETSP0786-20121207/14402_1 /TAXON_ID=186022 /ORGANISM="Thalassionema frauenfeldii, Strain CCMP 1798" /LENGTH=371 /DNA_ID=CAMNT_0020593299 /DNA_START=218 /DNA_END=1333 /DNA_ORIENTATION=+